MRDLDRMTAFLRKRADELGFDQTKRAIDYAASAHDGQFRKGSGNIPYFIHPVMMACHAIELGLLEDEILAVCLLHDVVEDCGVTSESLPFSDTVRRSVELLSHKEDGSISHEESRRRYYEAISVDRIAMLVKVIDRCNNVSEMAGVFTEEKLRSYMDETEQLVYPLIRKLGETYPEYESFCFITGYQTESLLASIRALI